MGSQVAVPVVCGLVLGVVVIFLVVLFRRVRHKRKAPSELPYRKHSTVKDGGKSAGGKLFRSKSTIRSEIPEFVIPGTQLRLVQPIITPPTPTRRKSSATRQPFASQDFSDGAPKCDEENVSVSPRPQRVSTVSLPFSNRRLSSHKPVSGTAMKEPVQRSSSLDPLLPKPITPPEIQVQRFSPVATSPSDKQPESRTSSVSSLDLLSFNVPPSTRSATSSLEGSREGSSQQSPEDSPRLLRLFRQSKHQIRLTGATIEFSVQYQVNQRSLVLNIMRVKNVLIPVDRKADSKLCISVHLKPDKFIWEAKTKIVSGTENPLFGEIFTIGGFSLTKLHDCAMLFRLLDLNVGHTIGEVTFSLRDLQPDVLTSRSCRLQRPLYAGKDRDRSYVGDLLVSFHYNPTDWKLNVRIIRARGLPKMTRGGHTDAFVKVNVMQDMHRIYKRKTHVQRHEWNPEFDEGFDFELTRDQMESTSITIKVIHRGKIRDHLIGVVLFGFNVDPMETGYQHWAMMLDKPNLSIEQWHKIYPVLK